MFSCSRVLYELTARVIALRNYNNKALSDQSTHGHLNSKLEILLCKNKHDPFSYQSRISDIIELHIL